MSDDVLRAEMPTDPTPLTEVARLYIEGLRESAQLGASARHRAGQPTPQVGDVWSTAAAPGQLPVLVAITWAGDDVYRGVPLLQDVRLATSDDIIADVDDSPTGEPVCLCSSLDTPLTADSLQEFIGTLPDSVIEPVAMILQSRLTGGFERRALEPSRLLTGEAACRWSMAWRGAESTETALEFLTGAPVIRSDDPRMLVQAELAALTKFLPSRALDGLGSAEKPPSVLQGVARVLSVPLSAFVPVSRPYLGVLGGDTQSAMSYQAFIGVLPDVAELAAFRGVRFWMDVRQSTRIRAELELRDDRDTERPAIKLEFEIQSFQGEAAQSLFIFPARSLASDSVILRRVADPASFFGTVSITVRIDEEDNE